MHHVSGSYEQPETSGHPLGLPVEEGGESSPRISSDRNREDMDAAAGVVDRHIQNGDQFTISTDHDIWSRVSSLAGGVDASDLAEIAKVMTRSYSELASVWIDIAGKLRELLNAQSKNDAAPTESAQSEGATPQASSSHAAPTLCIQADRKVMASIQIFQPGPVHRVQPLMAEASGIDTMIAEVEVSDAQIDICITPGTPPGRYHGVVLSSANAPIGAITVTVPDTAGPAS
ncbi:hypothetical protein ACS3SW_17470 [Roseobacteraceae bacterium S113]